MMLYLRRRRWKLRRSLPAVRAARLMLPSHAVSTPTRYERSNCWTTLALAARKEDSVELCSWGAAAESRLWHGTTNMAGPSETVSWPGANRPTVHVGNELLRTET